MKFTPPSHLSFNDIFPSKADPSRGCDSAQNHFQIIASSINAFQSSLDDQHEVSLVFGALGQPYAFHIDTLCHISPSLISFSGMVDGKRGQLIQHISQINFMMTAVAKEDPEIPPRRIGFSSFEQEAIETESIN